MTTVGINAIGTRHSGAATVLLSLLEGLLEIDKVDRIVVFVTPRAEQRFQLPSRERLSVVEVPKTASNPLLRFVWLNTIFRRYVSRAACDVVYNLNNLAGTLPVPQAVFLQQSLYFSSEALASYSRPSVPRKIRLRMQLEPGLMRASYWLSIRSSQAVVVQTELMKEFVCQELGVDDEKVHVIPPALPAFSIEGQRHSPDGWHAMREPGLSHWLYVGNGAPYKNLAVIVGAAKLAKEHGKPWHFHFVGPGEASLSHELVQIHAYLEQPGLMEAYSLAAGLIMPSLTETVGLPMLEALSMDIPVIAADRPYAHEICGESALYFDPLSAEALYCQLEKACQPAVRSNLRRHRQDVLRGYSGNTGERVWHVLSQLKTVHGFQEQ